jgi:hypothetical protein
MNEIDNIFKDVPATSFTVTKVEKIATIDDVYNQLCNLYSLTNDEKRKLEEGMSMEKLKNNQLLRMMLEIVATIINSAVKAGAADTVDETQFIQNKKVVRELAFSLFQLVNNYTYNDRDMKLLFLGKVIQSLHGSK